MYARLTGKIAEAFDDYFILDVNGVGYKVEAAFPALPGDTDLTLYIHTHVRENEIRLFGFRSSAELGLFEKLISVSGVGPKAGLALLRELGAERVVLAVESAQPELLKCTGVGKKTAERLVIELKNELKELGIAAGGDSEQQIRLHTQRDEVTDALVNLGYNGSDVARVLEAMETKGMSEPEIIKNALKKLQ